MQGEWVKSDWQHIRDGQEGLGNSGLSKVDGDRDVGFFWVVHGEESRMDDMGHLEGMVAKGKNTRSDAVGENDDRCHLVPFYPGRKEGDDGSHLVGKAAGAD